MERETKEQPQLAEPVSFIHNLEEPDFQLFILVDYSDNDDSQETIDQELRLRKQHIKIQLIEDEFDDIAMNRNQFYYERKLECATELWNEIRVLHEEILLYEKNFTEEYFTTNIYKTTRRKFKEVEILLGVAFDESRKNLQNKYHPATQVPQVDTEDAGIRGLVDLPETESIMQEGIVATMKNPTTEIISVVAFIEEDQQLAKVREIEEVQSPVELVSEPNRECKEHYKNTRQRNPDETYKSQVPCKEGPEQPGEWWNHVKSEENQTNIVSRGIEPSKLVNISLWWSSGVRGPKWLQQEDTEQRILLQGSSGITIEETIEELPTLRVTPSIQFHHIGIDYARPIQKRILKGEG